LPTDRKQEPEPKSGKESEVVFIPQKVADRLKDYIKEKGIEPDQRIFPITYNAARVMVIKAGKLVGIHLRPHDLRRFCATYASQKGSGYILSQKLNLFLAANKDITFKIRITKNE